MKKKVLLTGATGFVRKQVLKSLQKSNIEIVLVVKPKWQDRIDNFEKIVKVFESDDLFSESVEWWSDTCINIHTIIHMAWYAKPSEYLTSEKNIDCFIGTLNIAQGAINSSVKRFVGIGTCFEYDLAYDKLSANKTPLNPTTAYSTSKVASFLSLSLLFKQKNIDFLWCRLFYLYGKGENETRLVPYIKNRLSSGKVANLTNKDKVRDYLNVSIAGDMIASVSLRNVNGAVNICSGMPITIGQIAENIADSFGRRDLLQFGNSPKGKHDPYRIIGELDRLIFPSVKFNEKNIQF